MDTIDAADVFETSTLESGQRLLDGVGIDTV